MMIFSPQEKRRGVATKRALVSVLMFCSMVLGLSPKPVHAQMWGTSDIFGDMMMQMVDTIKRQIEGALIGTLKMAAIQMLNSKVGQLIGGASGGQPLFITDFNEFLYQSPRQKTNLYMNDFFSTMTRGKGSSANYISSGESSGLGGNYPSYLVASAKSVTTESGGISVYNLDQKGGIDNLNDPSTFSSFISNPANNPMGAELQAQEVWQDKLATEQNLAQIEATSSGFRADKTNGVIVAPAAVIEATFNNAADLPNKMIAAATNPGELLSGVVSAMANKLVSGLIQKGVGEVQSKISKEIRSVDNKISGAMNSQIQQLGPAAQYMSGINNNVNVIIKTNTPAPPAAKGW